MTGRYRYPASATLIAVLMIGLLPVAEAEFLLGWLREPASGWPWLLVFLLLEALIVAVASNQFPGLHVGPAGLRVQVFFFWWRPVPWEQVLDLRESRAPWQGGRCLVLERLTIVHQLFGLLTCGSRRPVVPLHPHISDHDELLLALDFYLSRPDQG